MTTTYITTHVKQDKDKGWQGEVRITQGTTPHPASFMLYGGHHQSQEEALTGAINEILKFSQAIRSNLGGVCANELTSLSTAYEMNSGF